MRVIIQIAMIMLGLTGGIVGSAQAQDSKSSAPLPAAKPTALYCDQAQSTADFQDCLNRRLQDAQTRLSDIFKKWEMAIPLIDKQADTAPSTPDTAPNVPSKDEQKADFTALQANQTLWLAYRDSECAWEKERADPALARIDELACLATLTEERADRLAALYVRDENNMPREFGSLSRWMNMIAHNNPDIFWRYNDVVQGDLNCNDVPDYIMTGLKMDDAGQPHMVVAISENPATGLPSVYTLDWPLLEQQQDDAQADNPVFCPATAQIEILEVPDGSAPACARHLTVSQGENCVVKHILWNGRAYIRE